MEYARKPPVKFRYNRKVIMRSKIENGILTLFFEGGLNTFAAEAMEREIEDILEVGGFSYVVIDMADLSYVSSAGLRIIIAIRQRCGNVRLVNVGEDVFHVLNMVGFHRILPIERK